MSQVITTHNSSGQAIFSSMLPEDQHDLSLLFGGMGLIYTSNSVPTGLNSEVDIDQYSHVRTAGLSGGAICPPGGTAAAIVSLRPGAQTPMHSTATMDWAVILERGRPYPGWRRDKTAAGGKFRGDARNYASMG